jgi:hypothetical protein
MSYYQLGAELTAAQQKQLADAQAFVAKWATIAASRPPGVGEPLKKMVADRQAIIARLTAIPTPPITPPTPPEPGTTPLTPQPSSIPAPAIPAPLPATPAPVETTLLETVSTTATEQTLVSGIPNAFVILGGVALLMLLSRRRA